MERRTRKKRQGRGTLHPKEQKETEQKMKTEEENGKERGVLEGRKREEEVQHTE